MKTPQGSHKPGKAKGQAVATLPLKVFIGYADFPAFRSATSSVADAIRSSNRHVELHPMLWRFEQLASSHWRTRAIHAALDADIVVLASSSPGAITPDVDGWISTFLNAARGRRTTLGVIPGPSDAWTISLEQSVKHAAPNTLEREPKETALVA